MANFTTADIKELREKTGAGLLDVKKALEEADGDQTKALEIIRVKGLKGVANREGRAASDGLVVAEIVETENGKEGILIELNSETDFVAKTENFGAFAQRIVAAAVASGAQNAEELVAYEYEGEKVSEIIDGTAAVLGEKIVLRRLARVQGDEVAVYLHRTSKDLPPQVGVLVATDSGAASIAKDIAMHIAAFSPDFLAREDVPEETVASERRIADETARAEGKPEAAMPKIIEGRLNGFFKENVLLEQAFAKEPKKSVGTIVNEAGGNVLGFVRFRVGA